MSAYYILTQTVTDPQKYGQEYVARVMPILAKHRGELIVGELEAKPLQGDPAKASSCFAFPPSRRSRIG